MPITPAHARRTTGQETDTMNQNLSTIDRLHAEILRHALSVREPSELHGRDLATWVARRAARELGPAPYRGLRHCRACLAASQGT